MPPSNGEIAELLARAAERETAHRQRAMVKASRAAMFRWPEEARDVAAAGRSLTELPTVGPWIARLIHEMLDEAPDPPEPPPERRGFMTRAEALSELERRPDLHRELRGDLQVHTTYSDGHLPLPEMVAAAADRGYEYVAITDHSKGLAIAGGMDEERLAEQGAEIDELNARLEDERAAIRVVKSIEMNLSPLGEGDMDPAALARLDLVLGAFHSKLREREDQTERYLAGVRNPTVHVLAHPRCRMYGRRRGLQADWRRVFEEALSLDKAVEADGTAHRQDLDADLLAVAADVGVRVSIGTDAHYLHELEYMEFALAAVARAGLSPDRILNFMPREELLEWAGTVAGPLG